MLQKENQGKGKKDKSEIQRKQKKFTLEEQRNLIRGDLKGEKG
jgi:hypothetical protein